MKMIKSRKGFFGPLAGGVYTLLGLFVATVLVFALALAGAQIKASTTDASAQGVIGNMSSGINQFAGLSPTLWLMVAIGMLLTIVFVAVGFAIAGKRE